MPKVLIVDDEKLLVKSTTLALKCYAFDVDGALDGPRGLEKAKQKPDIILLDIMMPGMDGWTVLEELKKSDDTKDIPVIIFTAKEYSSGSTMAKEHGAVDLVAKPFELEELVETINKHVAK